MSVTGLPKHGNSVKATFYFLINRHAKTNGHKYGLTDKNSVDLGSMGPVPFFWANAAGKT